jgi:uncharacterized repeat protein (TIGR01451 family)
MLELKRTEHRATSSRWLAGRLVGALMILCLGLVVAAAYPAWADVAAALAPLAESGDPPSSAGVGLVIHRLEADDLPTASEVSTATLPHWAREVLEAKSVPDAGTDLEIHKSVATGVENDTVVYNGEQITYTIAIANSTSAKAKDILVLDVLPVDTLEDIWCGGEPDCSRSSEQKSVPDPLGGTILVTITRELSWTIPSLPQGATIVLQFGGKVVGQQDGTEVFNRAFIQYTHMVDPSPVQKQGMSNVTDTIVRLRVEHPGEPGLSTAPTWLSADVGGTVDMDWGDYDHNGYLDLALGSTLGATVYRNDEGRLRSLPGSEDLTYGVSWGDFDGDGSLELVAVGQSADDTATTPGTNSVYTLTEDGFLETEFASDFQLVRIAPGDYHGDGSIDLVASTNSINADCPVQLYEYDEETGGFVSSDEKCISGPKEATAAIAPADYYNKGKLDLALGKFPNLTYLLVNSGTVTATNPFTDQILIPVETLAEFLAYDFAWGDYDGDGYLDLAAAFPLERKARIYRNQLGDGFDLVQEIPTRVFRTPLAVEWGDFDGDGHLDLAVADSPPKIYRYEDGTFSEIMTLPEAAVKGEVWSMRAIDEDNDGDLDLALSNRDGPSLLFTNFAPLLSPDLSGIPWVGTTAASSVAWGDFEGDGDLDLLFGAGPGAVGSKLYLNQKSVFPQDKMVSFLSSGFGPHAVAWGDVDGDRKLDVAIGVATLAGIQVYLSGNVADPDWTSSPPYTPIYSLAWGDSDDDGDLDLLAGGDGPVLLYLNSGSGLATSPAWQSPETANTRSVAWGDFDGDRYLDFAVGNYEEPVRLYRNNHDNTFSLAWSSDTVSKTTSVAWGDYDGDGDLDLAVGNEGQKNLIYDNVAPGLTGAGLSARAGRAGGQLGAAPIWYSTVSLKTTSLAWGDWDNDGDLDLAVGNDGEPDQVYVNLNSKPDAPPQLYWLWTSAESYRTSAVAWGDVDGDGDLDLAVAQKAKGKNGVYLNSYVSPSHLTDKFARTMPLPNNPSYVSVARPGVTPSAFFYSSAELLSGPLHPTVTIRYKLFDPDGTRDDHVVSNEAGDPIYATLFEYSLDGGGTWQEAHPMAGWSAPVTTTTRLGKSATFLWDAVGDQAIGDDVRFRVTIIPQNPVGPVQRSAVSAISPPFRIRGTTCVWPEAPSILIDTANPTSGDRVILEGAVAAGSGILTYLWDFDDGSTGKGQLVYHTYSLAGPHVVTMTVRSEACPIVKEVVTSTVVFVAQGQTTIFLPSIGRSTVSGEGEADASQGLSIDSNLEHSGAPTDGVALTRRGQDDVYATRPADDLIRGGEDQR